MMMVGGSALAVHDDGLFELDGNATNDVAVAGDDWDVVYNNRADDCAALSATANTIAACGFAHDAVNGSIFTTGGSKDEQEVETSWRHTDGSVPDKDDILDAFAAQYENGNLYFGADRAATNGDAQIGFWFFHEEISLADGGRFSGFHTAHDTQGTADPDDDTNGDILVLSNFSNGGTVPNIRVFEWWGVNDVRPLPGVPLNSACTGANAGDVACAITSGNGVASPWPFDPKSGPDNIFSSGAFYEGGIDLAGLGFGGDCFSTFLAETRSSTSITATLKDFALGQLGDCGATVTTQTSDATIEIETDGSVAVSDVATILGTGGVSNPNPTGTVDFHLCGPETSAITSCTATDDNLVVEDVALGGLTNPAIVNSGDVDVMSVGFYCWNAVYSGDDNYAGPLTDDGTNECFEVTPVTPTITTQATVGPVDPGDPIGDTATLEGTANDPDGSTAGGTITFNLYGPFAAGVTPDCTGTPVFTDTAPVSGDGDYSTDPDFDGTVTGFYYWVASYDGSSPNTNGATGACGDANETSEVAQTQPTLDTAQTWIPNDSATIDSDGGGDLDGTAHFALYASADCAVGGDAAVYSQDVDVNPIDGPEGATQTVGTSNTGSGPGSYVGSASGTTQYSWLVSYTSNLAGQAHIAATCVEVSTLTIDNDNSD
jgi:hypothetical protein